MLKPSYAAIKQFQSQKTFIKTIPQLKALLRRLDLAITLQIESPTIWKLSWDLLENTVDGTLEVRIQPCFLSGSESFEARHFTTLRMEEPVGLPISTMEGKLLSIIKDSLETIR